MLGSIIIEIKTDIEIENVSLQYLFGERSTDEYFVS